MTKLAHWRKTLTALLLSLLLAVSVGCSQTDTSPFADAQQESTEQGAAPAVADEAQKGGEFNRFFPRSGGGYDLVFSQEKQGFAEAKLKYEGEDIGLLAISDTISLPTAAQKYASSTETLDGYPVLDIGDTQTGVLVGDRYQVKAISRAPMFDAQARREWLQKFDLAALAALQ
ncbi:MAG: hypothetical protein AAFX78_10890 [Cyanobacteria bacterium J06638_20]